MSQELAIVLGLLAAAVVMFVINKPRMDVVALLVMTLLPFTGVVSMSETLSGFADSNIVLIAALFVIGEGLVRTGVARHLGDLLIKKAGKSEALLVALLMAVVCGLGSMMSSTAVTAIFIPVALRIAQRTGASAGRLMMPLSVAALISGMTTLVATAPNLVVSSELERAGAAGFQFFSFTPFGIPILVLGIAYMLVARKWLGRADTSDASVAGAAPARRSLSNWIEEYQLAKREHRLRVTVGSPLVGKALSELNLRSQSGANIIAIERNGRMGQTILQPTENTELLTGDVLLVDLFSDKCPIDSVRDKFQLEALPLSGTYFTDRSQDIGMAEVIVPADSPLIGKTVCESEFRTKTGLTVLGLRRGPEALASGVLEEKLKVGDTLLVVGAWKRIERITPEESGVLTLRMPADFEEVLPVAGRAPHAVFALLVTVTLMIGGWVPNVQAAFIGCLLMGALGCIDMVSAYKSINWKTLVLIVGMLPFSLALQRTGGVDLAADGLMSIAGGSGEYVILGALFIITALLGLFISNTATAVLMAPVAIAVAKDMGASPYPFAMIVALAASTAFMTPISSPVNTLVVAPGRYTFGDFMKVGTPFAVVVMIVCVFMVPWLMPLHPADAKPTSQSPLPAAVAGPDARISP